jgi:hypothetical protein
MRKHITGRNVKMIRDFSNQHDRAAEKGVRKNSLPSTPCVAKN